MTGQTTFPAYGNSASLSRHSRLKDVIPGGVHYNFRTLGAEEPRFFKEGRGSRLFDLDGNEYLDLYAKFGAMILGHTHSEYDEALIGQIRRVQCVNHADRDLETAEALGKLVPGAEMVRFGLSGSEMVQNALRLARAHTGRNKFVRFEGHYHGNTDNILGGTSNNGEPPYPVDFRGDPRGTKGRANGIMEAQSLILPWNRPEILEETLDRHSGDIAAVIMEPILINGGGIPPLPGYLEYVRKLCTRYGILLVFDEIITGFRVALGGAQSLTGVIPDLTIMGKAIGGGLPISVLGGRREFMTHFATREVVHAGTFNGYPLGIAAVGATMEILARDQGAFYAAAAARLSEIGNALTESAAEIGIFITYRIFGAVLVYNCAPTAPCFAEELGLEVQILNRIVNMVLADHGILISPVSRMFANLQMHEGDLEFFRHRIRAAMRGVREKVDATFGIDWTNAANPSGVPFQEASSHR